MSPPLFVGLYSFEACCMDIFCTCFIHLFFKLTIKSETYMWVLSMYKRFKKKIKLNVKKYIYKKKKKKKKNDVIDLKKVPIINL
jgi:hypothetical protein